jgi:tRNA A-37 threonylcarbamoyl transferase component Bud32
MENYSKCPIEKIQYFMKTNHDCIWVEHPNKKKEIGSGEDAIIFQICCSKNESLSCEYVVKVQTSNRNRYFEKEVNLHIAFSELGIGIPIIDAFMCDQHGSFLIMEKRDFTPEEYVKFLQENGKGNDFISRQIENMKNEALRITLIGFENGLNHNDLHANNIMLNANPDFTFSGLTLIDFGKSKREQLSERDIQEELDDFSLSFDRLKNLLQEKKKTRSPPQVKKRKEKKAYTEFAPRTRGMFDDEDFGTPKKKRGGMFDDENFGTPKKSFTTPKKKGGGMFDDDFGTPKKGGLDFDEL